MGNKNIGSINIENYPAKKSDLQLLLNSTSEKDKAAASKEKENLKLINKHNKEMKDSNIIEECLINHPFLRALEKQARKEIIKEVSQYYIKSNVEIFKH